MSSPITAVSDKAGGEANVVLLSESVKSGAYTTIDRLAVGGTAEIHRASHRTVEGTQLVIIKRLTEASRQDDDLRTLFELEADLGRQLTHPNIARMLDMGFEAGDLYLVFEYLDGPNLQRLLDEVRRRELLLPFKLCASILYRVLDALHFAHDLKSPSGELLGLVHRDVNARNVLTSFSGHVALIDFGIARTQEFEGGSAEEVVRGKLGSVAPEQLRGEPVDRRVDLFAAGVLTYEMLIGSHPFKHKGADEDHVLDSILGGDFISPHALAPELPKDVLDMMKAAMSPKVGDRPASAREMAEIVVQYADEDAENTLANILRKMFPSQLASVENLRYIAES